jgi:PKD repeat protein
LGAGRRHPLFTLRKPWLQNGMRHRKGQAGTSLDPKSTKIPKRVLDFPLRSPSQRGSSKEDYSLAQILHFPPMVMKTLQTLVMVLLLGSALQSQTAWASWNIYRDSTGSGADPVDGSLVCPNDTVWLIVDTTGMGAAGITGWRWRYDASGMPLTLVHCEGPGCPDDLPFPFPYPGLLNKLKVGVRVGPFTATYNFLLVTYYANGDSLITAKAIQVKGGNASLSLPFWACAGSSVPVHVDVRGILDSFVVSYTIGSTTYEIRNQTDFTITLPSGDGTLTLTLTQYVCGNSFTGNYGISHYSSAPSPGPVPFVWTSIVSSCPSIPRDFRVFSLPPGYTSFVWKVNGDTVDRSSTNHPLAYTWLPPGPGTYNISYEATYPCGTVSGSTVVTINPAPTPTLSVSVDPLPGWNGYCPGYSGLQITASASVPGGLYSIDVGNDGIIESYYPSYSLPSPGVIPAGGLPIKVSFDDGCGNVVDTTFNYVPSSMADPESYTASASISPLSYPRCSGDSIDVSLSVAYFPEDSIRNIQWSWDGSTWTPPSNSFTARLATPLTSGPWTLYCRFDAFSPDPCVVAPTSPISTSISADLGYPPLLRQIGSVCLSGGTVGLVPDITTYPPGIDSIRYVLPDGTVIKRHIRDTLLLNIPSGVFSYPVVYQGQGSCGYTVEHVYTITPEQTPPPLEAGVSASSVCSGGNVLISSYHPPHFSVDSIVAILWNGDRVRMPMTGWSSATISVAAPNAPGTYSVQVIAYNCAGSDTASIAFQVISGTAAVADFTGPSTACVGDTVIFQRSGTNRGVTQVYWSFGDGSSLRDTAMQVAHIYTRAGTYRVRLDLTSVECGSSVDEYLIRVYDAPPTLSGLSVEPSGLSISYSVSASDYDQIVWDFGDGNTATGVLSGTHTYATSGTYTVTVTAINACDTSESSVTIVVTGLALGRSGGWLVYPNPTRQEVFIAHPSYQGEVRVEVYDLMGRLVQAEEISAYPGRMRLNLPNGLYTLRLISREGVATTKLLVE